MIFIKSMQGLGDNIYQRHFCANLPEFWIDTPWPELYCDMPGAHFVRSNSTLRTQAKNVAKSQVKYEKPPIGAKIISPSYREDGIYSGMIRAFGGNPVDVSLPSFQSSVIPCKPYAIVRPATVRKEWLAESRNPFPEYIAEAAQIAREAGLLVVSVADLDHGKEWALEPLPVADFAYHRGELSVTDLMALVENASIVIGGIGWIVPACIAYKAPAWVICGGQLGYNYPDKLTDQRICHNITFAIPDKQCHCTQRSHNCDKRIAGHSERFRAYLESRNGDWLPHGKAD